MAKRTYAPELARMLQRIVAYYGKHQVSINAVITDQQRSDLNSITATINGSGGWGSVNTRGLP